MSHARLSLVAIAVLGLPAPPDVGAQDYIGRLAVCGERPDLVQPYLDLYLSRVDARTGTIRDVADLGTGALRRSDSDDSYAATFLSLATKYRASPGGGRWWARNRVRLKEVA